MSSAEGHTQIAAFRSSITCCYGKGGLSLGRRHLRGVGGLGTVRGAVVRAVLVALAVGLSVSACGGGSPEPKTIEDTPAAKHRTSTPTPKPSPSKTTPGKVILTGPPGKVDPQTTAEVKHFIEGYLSAQNKATGNGDFTAVDKMIKSCVVCAQSKKYISSAYASGGKVEGGIFTKPRIVVSGHHGNRVLVSVHAVISAYKTTNGSGKVVEQGPAEGQDFQYSVSKIDGRWLIVEGSSPG